jgi:hypothetical protein
MTLTFVLLILAFILLFLAAINIPVSPSRIQLGWLGLALLVLSMILKG